MKRGVLLWKVLVRKLSAWRKKSWMADRSRRKRRGGSFVQKMKTPCCFLPWRIKSVKNSVAALWISALSSMREAGTARKTASFAPSPAGTGQAPRYTVCYRKNRLSKRQRKQKRQAPSGSPLLPAAVIRTIPMSLKKLLRS